MMTEHEIGVELDSLALSQFTDPKGFAKEFRRAPVEVQRAWFDNERRISAASKAKDEAAAQAKRDAETAERAKVDARRELIGPDLLGLIDTGVGIAKMIAHMIDGADPDRVIRRHVAVVEELSANKPSYPVSPADEQRRADALSNAVWMLLLAEHRR